jgi:hypothetical protein
MKIIDFPSTQRNQNVTVAYHPNQSASLLLQYREAAQGEFLAWSICVAAAVASIVLCLSQLEHDVNRLERVHVNQIGMSQLVDENRSAVEPSKQLE